MPPLAGGEGWRRCRRVTFSRGGEELLEGGGGSRVEEWVHGVCGELARPRPKGGRALGEEQLGQEEMHGDCGNELDMCPLL